MKKLTLLFALLCASVMGVQAINWDSYSWIGNGSGNAAYTDAMKIDLPSGIGVVNLQSSFGTEAGIYITTPSAAGLTCDLGAGHFATQGAGMLLYLSAFTMQETPVTVTSEGTDYIVTVYWKDGEPEDLTGWNIAKGKTSVAGHNAQGGHAAANDGKFNTRWSSEGGQHYAAVGDAAEDWWYVDLGNFYTVNTIKILFETACPNDYDILISNNGASWTVIGTYTTSPKTGSNPDTDYNEYSFTDKVGRYVKIFARNGYNNMQYGFSMYEFEVYGERATLEDHNPPTMTSAALSGDPEWNQVHLTVAGTDTEDGAVTSFHVTDATHSVDQTCGATAGIITVTDLSGETSYNLNVKAVDAAGNESEEGIVVNVTTPVDTSVPLVAAPTPSGTNKEVVHIYSDAFPSTDGHSSCLAHDFKKDGFAGVALMQEKNISGDKCLIYNINGAAEVTCGHYDGGINAIIAADGFHHESYAGIDATEMEYLHIDIWSLQACSNINIQINDVSLNTKRSHNGNGWNSYDIPLTDYTFGDTEHTRRANVRFMKFNGLASITGKMALDNIYFWKTAAGLKSVSATPNNPAMGTATVKQLGADVTEVTTGSEVTFNAVANDGYIFVNWSNNETAATFDAEVNANMNLTANFRALNHISCNEEMTNGDYTVYVTYRKTANENEYEFIVRSAKEMTGFSNAYIGKINGNNQVNLNGQGSLTGNGHKLSYTFTSTTEPKLNTPLYVNFANHGEVTFNQINNGTVFEFAVACADPEITAIALDKTEATLDMGNTLTLKPSFTPAYMSADIEWLTSDDAVATVANGVVTPVDPGTATITAKISETVKATCAVTVQAAAPPTKSVSATPNDPAMGTANVKQLGADVTEVEAGTTVTFSAVANDGYIFVNWSNNETAATFDAEVNANMNLTANFRALNHISCNEEMTNGDYTVYVTYRKTANENEYEFIVRSAKEMTGFSNAYIGKINGNNQVNLNGQGSLTGNGHKLSYTFTSTTEPKLNTPLYVNFANHGEVTFSQINNGTVFEFAVACADPEITAIALDKTEATLDMGNTLTLKPSFTPAYMSADIEWLTSDDAVATVANGVVTPVDPGTATITAKISETVKATCAVTVQAAASHNWYGYGTSEDLDYTYRIEYTTDHHIVAHVKRQGNKTGLVNASMNINNIWTDINVTEGEPEGWKKGTTAQTYTAGDAITIHIQSNWAGPSSIVEFAYTVGADNEMPTIVPSVLKLNTTSMTLSIEDADVQLTTEIHHRDAANQTITWTSDDENVVTVENGLVHPVGVGSTTVRANTFNNVEATCTVTVVGVLEPTVFWGNGADNGVSIAYSITRNTDRTLTYAIEALQNKSDFGVQVNDGDYHTAALNEGIYTWTSTATYTDGALLNGFIYMPFSGGAARVDFSYTVGSETARKYIPITLKDDDNNFVISASNNAIREVKLSRTFPNTDEWYTICLPFDLSDEQLMEVFGAGYTLAELIDSEDRGSLIHLNFDYAPAFTAGKAYLLRPGTGVTSAPTFNGVTVKNVTPIVSGDDLMHFQGTFNLITLDQDNQRFVGPENYLYSPAANGTNMKAFRCFFTIPDGPQQNNVMGKRARIVFGPQETTDIDQINDQEPNTTGKLLINGQLYIIRDGKTYNAQGMLVK